MRIRLRTFLLVSLLAGTLCGLRGSCYVFTSQRVEELMTDGCRVANQRGEGSGWTGFLDWTLGRRWSVEIVDNLPADTWDRLQKLNGIEELSVFEKQSASNHLAAIGSLSSLKDLTVHRAHRDLPSVICRLPGLTSIELEGKAIDDESIEPLQACADRLKRLDLSYTAIGDPTAETIAACHQLEELSLAHTEISDSGIQRIAVLQQLRAINLEGTYMTGDSIPSIAQLRQLRRLMIRHVDLPHDTTRALQPLSNLPLEYLTVSHVYLDENGKLELARFFPHCDIRWIMGTQGRMESRFQGYHRHTGLEFGSDLPGKTISIRKEPMVPAKGAAAGPDYDTNPFSDSPSFEGGSRQH